MLIVGLNKTTLLDYPGRVAATIFTGGCNFRCPFCHNGDLVLKASALDAYSEEEVFSFLHKRKKVLGGVCITGGEPTLQPDLAEFIRKVKELGYAVKLDTNGYKPKVLEELLKEDLLDYLAMDLKNRKEKYAETAGVTDFVLENIERSMELLTAYEVPHEFRTTVVKEFHEQEDLEAICRWIGGQATFYLQQYRDSEEILAKVQGGSFADAKGFHGYEDAVLKALVEELNRMPEMTGRIFLRGMD